MFFVTSDVIGQAGSAAPQPRTVPGLPRSQPVARSPVPGPSRSQRASRSPVPGPHLVYRRKASAVGPREDRVWLGRVSSGHGSHRRRPWPVMGAL